MSIPYNRCGVRAFAAFAAALLSAGAALASPPATTTLGTRTAASQPNPAITANAGGAWENYARPLDYPKYTTLPLQFITLKSGKKIAVLVSVPADAAGKAVSGTFPAILTQTAYRIDLANLLGALLPFDATQAGGADRFMIRRGYISVTTDVIGTGMSDGEMELWSADEQETYGETVNWILQQPWSNGTIGVAGTSYLGITSLLTAEQQNPAVKAVFAQVPGGDPYRSVVGIGGLLNAMSVSLWLPATEALTVSNGIAEKEYPQDAQQIAVATRQHIAAVSDFLLPLVDNALGGASGYATDDGDFWAQRSPLENAAKIQVPTFIIGGFHDAFQRDEPLLYEQLKRNVNVKLLIVPGAHIEAAVDSVIDADSAAAEGAPSSVVLMLQWFDQYLKGMDTGAATLPTITQYVSGYGASGGGYRFASTTDWPHPLASPERLYLHGDMSLSAQAPVKGEATHTVAEPAAAKVAISTADSGKYLLADVTLHDDSGCSISFVQWTLGAAALLGKPCYHNDDTVEQAQKALNYETPALAADLYVNGPLEADVWMSSTVTAAALSVRVDDVEPDGTAVPLTNGLMSASYRAVDTTRSRYIDGVMIQPWHAYTTASELPVVPGQPMLVPVEIFPTAALIRRGHKLRISISASNQAEAIWSTPDQVRANGGVSTIYNDPQHPSSVVLPLVPTSTLK
ncbi:MAG: CocE/NonD family hydrolase [Nevskia sp.]|nr:CocE/NonD family hydrolase [Nevskia sp.]